MSVIELYFPALGDEMPTDHGYPLYGALSKLVPALHAADVPIRVAPIAGHYEGNGRLRLDRKRSRLRLRLPAEQIGIVLPLAGRSLEIAGHHIRLGVPQVRGLVPAPTLVARMVTIKRSTRTSSDGSTYMEPERFLDGVHRELEQLAVHGEAGIPLVVSGPHAGSPRRHVLRIKNKQIVGFSVQISGLTAEESILVQEHGVGGRKKMGCGWFVALRS